MQALLILEGFGTVRRSTTFPYEYMSLNDFVIIARLCTAVNV